MTKSNLNNIQGPQGHNTSMHFLDAVDTCPRCHVKQVPMQIGNRWNGRRTAEGRIWIFHQCTSNTCREVFLARYKKANNTETQLSYDLENLSPIKHESGEFSEDIQQISTRFVEIYNQASEAEARGLSDVCGPGYRKALEFLVKDYSVSALGKDESKIKGMPLGNCIQHHIDSQKIKDVAARATWLGNDETHYERRLEGGDLKLLKSLIQLVVSFIDDDLLYRKVMETVNKDGVAGPEA